MRRFFSALAAFLTLLAVFLAAAAPAADRPKIIVGGDHENPPFELLDNGKPTGFNVELMREVAKTLGIDVEFRLGPWGKVRKELEEGKIDALAGMYFSEERSKSVDFSVPHTMVSPGLFVRRDSPIHSVEEIKGKEIIVQKGDAIDDYLREKGITSRIIQVKDPADELRLLSSGRHDCALMPSRFQGEYLIHNLGLSNIRVIPTNLPQLRYCFAVHKGNNPLRYRLDEGLDILKVNGTYKRIYEKWFGVYEERSLWRTLRYFVWALAVIAGLLGAISIWSWFLRREVRKRTAEIREREESLRNSEGRLHTLVQTLPDLVWLKDMNGVYLSCNSIFERFFGAAEADIVGKTDYDFVDRELADFFIMNDHKAVAAGKPAINEEWITFADNGHRALLETIKTPVYDASGALIGVLGIGRDITQRKQAEEALRESEEKFRVLAETSSAGICVYQGENNIYVNAAMTRLTGYTERELKEMKFWEWMHEDYREQTKERGMARQRGEAVPSQYEIKYITKEREEKWFFLSAGLIEYEGKPAGIVTMFDITDRKRVEDELRAARDELEKRVEERTLALRNANELLQHANRELSSEIEARKAAVEESIRSISLLKATIESTADGILVVDRTGKVIDFNERFLELWNIPMDVIISRDDDKVLSYVLGQLRNPDEFITKVRELYGHPEEESLDILYFRDGRVFERYSRPQLVENQFNGRVWSFRDITKRRKAEEALRESESRVRRKLESILDPEADIGELELADIIDAPGIQALMDDLNRNTGIKMSIIDLKGQVLVDVGWQEICLKFHRGHPETRERCRISDTTMTEGVPPGWFRRYHCLNNMWHMVTPIMVGGRHMGNLFMGQFFFENEELDYDLFRAQAKKYGFPEEEYMASLEAVPRYSEECVNNAKAFFLRMIGMFSKLSYGNIKLARLLAERDRLTEKLRQANKVVENSPVVLFRWGGEDEWPVELVSANVVQFGYAPEEFLSRAITYSAIIHPGDLERVTREVHDICDGGGELLRLEYRIMSKEGVVRWVNELTNVERDEAGCVKGFEGVVVDVTERRLAEDAIRESRAKYQAIVDNFDGYIYICSQDYRVEFMNRKLIERTGYDATGELCYKVMHDRDSICPWCVNERVFAGETLHWEMFSPKDNRWFYVVNVPIPHSDGTVSKQSMMLDITERKRAEEELRKANMVVENSPVVLFSCKAAPGWPVELVSKNVVQFGYTPEEFLSGEITYSSIVYPRDLEKLIAETDKYSATGKEQWLQEYRIVTKWGDIRWIIDETVCERNEAGEITHYEGVVIDVTDRRRAEEQLILQQIQLRELNSTLEERVKDEVEKNRAKDVIMIQQNRQAALGEILDHIAHQWKQPLNIISLATYILMGNEKLSMEEVKVMAKNIHDQVEHMDQTVKVFRDFYRPDKEKSVFVIRESIDRAISLIMMALRVESVKIEIEADPMLVAVGYPKEFAQVILNLVSNARDVFREKKVENPKLLVKAFAEGDMAVVTVTDNGGGICEADLRRIFDLNFTTKEQSGGTGVGLYMSKKIIERRMEGTLTAANVTGGAQFMIRLKSAAPEVIAEG